MEITPEIYLANKQKEVLKNQIIDIIRWCINDQKIIDYGKDFIEQTFDECSEEGWEAVLQTLGLVSDVSFDNANTLKNEIILYFINNKKDNIYKKQR